MKMQMYTLYSKKHKVHDGIKLFIDDEAAAYEFTIKTPSEYQPLTLIYNVGEIDILTGDVLPHSPKIVEWDMIDYSKPVIESAPVEFGPQQEVDPRKIQNQFLNRTADIGHKQKK